MDLLEYQAKQLFTEVGIPVLPSQWISNAGDLKTLHIPYPVVLKSQVLASGRAKLGGVRFVENTIDAIAVAQSIFNLSIEGEYPQVILAESRYDAENEFFLGIMFDYTQQKPVLMGSSQGGINVENLLDNLEICVLDDDFSPFYARHLATQMGLSGDKIAPIANIIEKMYQLMIKYDLDIIEINPLGVNNSGEVMALDGKIRVNDHSLKRHPELLQYVNQEININEQLWCVIPMSENSNTVIITDSQDRGFFLINRLQEENQDINSCYIMASKNQEIWELEIEKIINVVVNDNIETVIINHDNYDNFVSVLLNYLSKYYQQNIVEKEKYIQDRVERPTGMRLWNETTKQIKTSNTPKIVKIQWIIQGFNTALRVKMDSFSSLKNIVFKNYIT